MVYTPAGSRCLSARWARGTYTSAPASAGTALPPGLPQSPQTGTTQYTHIKSVKMFQVYFSASY